MQNESSRAICTPPSAIILRASNLARLEADDPLQLDRAMRALAKGAPTPQEMFDALVRDLLRAGPESV